ncbi:MAG TPA: DUF1080 domain-containing protein [Bacteroidales bacterium]|nr:DUF1080 domain-containing protein [Bacteroidales bacterium]
MKRHTFSTVMAITMVAGFTSCKTGNTASDKEKDTTTAQWVSLFDGKTLDGWHSFNSDTVAGWTVIDGCLTGLGEGSDLTGDLVTDKEYKDFELSLEWKIAEGGNSGVLYHVVEDGNHKTTYETGPEYQLIDDEGYPGHLEEWQKTAANYAMHLPDNKVVKPVGEFNTTRIVVDGSHVEHWLNGKKVLEFEMWTDDWKERVADGKWKDYPDYGLAKKGHIALQDHGSKVWFKDIRIKEL